jgi:dienelactone hydrolase
MASVFARITARRARRKLYALLGRLPRERPLGSRGRIPAQLHSVREGSDYVLEHLSLELNGHETVPAYFVKPRWAADRCPVVLYNHAHGGRYELGKEELIGGRESLQSPPYAVELARRGIAALCIDHWVFGERAGSVRGGPEEEQYRFKEMLWHGTVLWGMMVYDSLRAVDYLSTRDDVEAGRIGTLGMSMGSTMAWWLAALDTRIRVCVDICCMTEYRSLLESRGLNGHSIYYYVPDLLNHFSTERINRLIVPRPHLSMAGDRDPLTPPSGLDRIDAAMRRAYARVGAPKHWRMLRSDEGHVETAAFRREALAFLERHL